MADDWASIKELKEIIRNFPHLNSSKHYQNMELMRTGTSFRELSFGGHALPPEYRAQRYCVKMHGTGMCDEFPTIYYPEDYIEGAFDYHLEPGMYSASKSMRATSADVTV